MCAHPLPLLLIWCRPAQYFIAILVGAFEEAKATMAAEERKALAL